MQQTLQVTIKLKVKHEPGNEAHLKHVVREYFRSKGITLSEELEIEV